MRKSIYFSLIAIITLTVTFSQISFAATQHQLVTMPHSNVIIQGKNSLTGFVFAGARQPVSDIYVELLNDLYSTVARVRTSGSGFYSFRGLKDGNYKVKVLAHGTDYEEQVQSVSLVSISAIAGRGSVSEQLDIYLKVKKNTNSGPLAAPGVIFAQEVPDSAKKLYEAGINDLRDKKEVEGFEKLKKSIEIFPTYFSALDRLGTEYVLRGYYRPAFVLLTKALEVNPRSYSSTFGLGLSQYQLQLFDAAIENLQRATQIYNDSINAHLWLGIALHRSGKLSQAETALTQANKLSTNESSEVHWQLARLYSDQKRYNEAANELELFLKHSPNSTETEKIKQAIIQLRQKATAK